MNFLNPLVLLGLVAALIPLLLHLLNLRRLRQQDFSTLRFLKQLERSTIRRFRLQQLLLLAVRMLLIAAVVLAFARPVLPAKLPGLQQRAPVSVLLVLDNSASMALGERFAAARRAAMELLRSLNADDEVLLLPVVSDTVLPEWATNHGAVLEQLQRMQPTATTASLSVVLRRAIGLLGQARHWHRQVYVVSDFHRTQLGAQLPAELRLDARTQLFFVPVGSAQQPAAGEVVLDSVALVSQLHATGQPVVVHARLRNLGERDATVVVSLFLGQERVAQQSLMLRARKAQTVLLSAPLPQPGLCPIRVTVEGDATEFGNERYSAVIVPQSIEVVLIADPEAQPFLQTALQALPVQNSPLRLRALPAEGISAGNLAGAAVVVAASSALTVQQLEQLATYVRAGGRLLLFAADGATLQALPQWLARVGIAGAALRQFSAQQAVTLARVDKQHPIFRGVFRGETEATALPETPALVRQLVVPASAPIVESSAGPLVVEHALGKGRMLVCGVAPLPQWGEFPYSGFFPTFLVRAVLYLGMRALPTLSAEAGQELELMLPGYFGPELRLREPAGGELLRQPRATATGTYLWLGRLQEPGVYGVFAPDGTPVAAVAVNVPQSELEAVPATPSELRRWAASIVSASEQFAVIEDAGELVRLPQQVSSATELWQLLLVIALLCAAVEIGLSKAIARHATDE